MNRKIIGFALVLFLCMGFQSAYADAGVDKAYLLEITDTRFLPETIYVGDIVSVAVDVENTGSVLTVVDLEAELDIGNQFEGIELTDTIDQIKKDTVKTLVFKFMVKEDTLPGYYSATITIDYVREGTDITVTETETIIIPVTKSEKNLDVTLEPRVINPGNQTDVVFTVKNIGGTPVSNLSFTWTEENNFILPVGTDNKRYVSVLMAGEEAIVSYIMAADPNIETGIYPLDITMSFTDIDGTKTQESQLGIIVGGKTDFEVSAEILTTGQLSISIANIGSNNADAVVVRIPEQEGISTSGTNTSILGNLNKGDFTLANFEVRTTTIRTGQAPGTVPRPSEGDRTDNRRTLLMEIDYTDTTGERQSVQKTIEMDFVFSETETGFAGRKQAGNTNAYFAWALLLVFACGTVAVNKYKAGRDWKKIAKILAVLAILWLATIFLLGSGITAIIIVAIISFAILAWFFKARVKAILQKSE